MKVTARDLAGLVRETKKRQRKDPRASNIGGLIQDEMAKITSLFEAGGSTGTAQGAAQLDPSAFVRSDHWRAATAGPSAPNEFDGGPQTQATYHPGERRRHWPPRRQARRDRLQVSRQPLVDFPLDIRRGQLEEANR